MRLGKLAAALIAVAHVFAPAPAGAIPAAVAFVGTFDVKPGLGYPLLSVPSAGTWRLNVGGVGVTVGGASGFAMGGPQGDLSAGVVQSSLPSQFNAGAFCGASGGDSGAGTIYVGLTPVPLNNMGWLQSVGTLIVMTNNNGNLVSATIFGVLNVLPPPITGTGSCLSGTGLQFTTVGAMVSIV